MHRARAELPDVSGLTMSWEIVSTYGYLVAWPGAQTHRRGHNQSLSVARTHSAAGGESLPGGKTYASRFAGGRVFGQGVIRGLYGCKAMVWGVPARGGGIFKQEGEGEGAGEGEGEGEEWCLYLCM